jgi:hypothetical protein
MIIPTDPTLKAEYLKFIVDTCFLSKKERKDMYGRRRQFMLFGTAGDQEVIYNRLESHLDLVCAFLYSADSAQFSLSAPLNAGDEEVKKFMAAQDTYNNDFRDAGMFDYFGDSLIWSLCYDSVILKMGWSETREDTTAVRIPPWKFGVFSEELEDLDSQPAFVHQYHIDYDNACERLKRAGLQDRIKDLGLTNTPYESPFPELITRMIIASSAGSNLMNSVSGAVNPSYTSRPSYQAKVDRPLVLFNEVTVWDDECNDYRVFWHADPDIIISDSKETIAVLKRTGEFKPQREQQQQFYNTECNPFFPQEHPYIHIRPYQTDDYFWGKAHIDSLIPLQNWSNERLEQIHDLLEKQAYPPRVGSGFMGLSDEKMDAFGGADTWVMDQLPGAKIEELSPKMPDDIFADFQSIGAIFLEASGLTEVLQGKGDQGVRSRGHAKQLQTTGAGRIKKAAVRLEAPLVRMGSLGLKLHMRNCDDRIQPDPREDGKEGDPFFYANLGARFNMRIQGHSHSPLFADDTKELAGALFKATAIDQEGLLRLLNPPNRDNLIHSLRTRKKKQEQMAMMQRASGQPPPKPGSRGKANSSGAGLPA